MNDLIKDIKIDLIVSNVKANSQKQVFKALASEAAKLSGLQEPELYEALIASEKESGSGIGDGVAIPHIRLGQLKQSLMILVRLEEAITFDAVDGEPVSLICMVLSPEKEGALHLRRLARISRLLRHNQLRKHLRNADSADAMYSIIESATTDLMMAA